MNVLIISLAYAPYSGVGAARMTSLSKYLLNKGCSVSVVCYSSLVFGEKEQKREVPKGVKRICVERLADKGKNRKNIENAVEQAIKEDKFDVCISSVGPYDTMFFIHKVWTKWKVPYIIDYRDTWLFEKTTIKPTGWLKFKLLVHDYLYQPVERRAIKYAAKIVSVTRRCQEDLIDRYRIPGEKCIVIYNGYEDAPSDDIESAYNEYVIGIAGKFASYNQEAAESFLAACKEVNAEEAVKVLHIGNREELLAKNYSEVYYGAGEKNHKDTMAELAKADALLVSYAHICGLGTKVFDYIALNKPIIYVGVVPSELADFVGQFENSYICADRVQMEKTIRKLLQKKEKFLTVKDVTIYSREKQNEMFMGTIFKTKQEVKNNEH